MVLAGGRIAEVVEPGAIADVVVEAIGYDADGRVELPSRLAAGRDDRERPVVVTAWSLNHRRSRTRVDHQRRSPSSSRTCRASSCSRGGVELRDERPVPGEPAVRPSRRSAPLSSRSSSWVAAVVDDRARADVVAAVHREQDLAGRGEDWPCLRSTMRRSRPPPRPRPGRLWRSGRAVAERALTKSRGRGVGDPFLGPVGVVRSRSALAWSLAAGPVRRRAAEPG